jgi:hypothetical protein
VSDNDLSGIREVRWFRFGTRRPRSLAAVLLMSAAALLGSALPASADTGPDGFPILYADEANMVHHCIALDTTNVAIVCVNIVTGETGDGYYATGQVEAYCQDGSDNYVSCAEIDLSGGFANGAGSLQEPGYYCDGNCPSGRVTLTLGSYSYTPGHDCTSSTKNDVWDLVLNGTEIVPPAEVPAWLVGNYSTGHDWICP